MGPSCGKAGSTLEESAFSPIAHTTLQAGVPGHDHGLGGALGARRAPMGMNSGLVEMLVGIFEDARQPHGMGLEFRERTTKEADGRQGALCHKFEYQKS